MKRRIWIIIVLCLAVCLAMSAFGSIAAAEEIIETIEVEADLSDLGARVTSEIAEKEYLNSVFGLPVTPVEEYSVPLRGYVGGEGLGESSRERIVYNALREQVEQVAAGNLSSTSFVFENIFTFAAADLDMDGQDLFELRDDGYYHIRDAASTKVQELMAGVPNKAFKAVLYDCPYEMFWMDKGEGKNIFSAQSSYGGTLSPVQTITVSMTIRIMVNNSYIGNSQYTINSSKIQGVHDAADNAGSIVQTNAGLDDYEKLTAYKNEICRLTDYNHEAADEKQWTEGYGDPWQLVWVFDGNPGTTVVCEGYSKAFMYLCDQSEWSEEDAVKVICVSGEMDGGPHMWNIVQMNNHHYIADVTNSDGNVAEGNRPAIGANGGLFLDGYTDTGANDKTYYYTAGGSEIEYIFDDDTYAQFNKDGWLGLSATAASAPALTARTAGEYETISAGNDILLIPQDKVLAVEIQNNSANFYGAYITEYGQTDEIADTHPVEKEWVPGWTVVHIPMTNCEANKTYEVHVYTSGGGEDNRLVTSDTGIRFQVTPVQGAIVVSMNDEYVVSAPICFYARYTGGAALTENEWLRLRIFEAEDYCPLEERFNPGDNWYDKGGDPNDFWETDLRIGRPGDYVLEAAIWTRDENENDQILEDTVVTKEFTLTKTGELEAPVFVDLPATVSATELSNFSFSFTTKFPQHINVIITKDGWDEAAYFAEASFWYDGEGEDYNDPDKADQYLAATWGMPGLSYEDGETGTEGNMKNGKVVCRPGFPEDMEYGEYQIHIMADRWNYETGSLDASFMIVPGEAEMIVLEPEGESGSAGHPAAMCSGLHVVAYAPDAENIFFYVNDTIQQAEPGALAEYYGMLTDEETVIRAEAVAEDGTKETIGEETLYAQGAQLNDGFLPEIPDTMTAGEDWSITIERPAVEEGTRVQYEAQFSDLEDGWAWIRITPDGENWGMLNDDTELSVDGDDLIVGHTYELKLNIFAEGYQPIYITRKITAVAEEKTHNPILLSAVIREFDENTHQPTETEIQSPATLLLHQPVLFRFQVPDAVMVRFWKGEEFEYLEPEENCEYQYDWDYWFTGTVQVFAQACYEEPGEDEEPVWEPVTEDEIFTIELITEGAPTGMTVRFDGEADIGAVTQGNWINVTLQGENGYTGYNICAATVYQYDREIIRKDMRLDGTQYSCRIPTTMLEPGYYHIVVFAEETGKPNVDKHSSFVVLENEHAPASGLWLTTTAQPVEEEDYDYTVPAFDDFQVSFWAPEREGYRKYYRFFNGYEWQYEWGAYGSRTLSLDPGRQSVQVEVHYINKEDEADEIVLSDALVFEVEGGENGIELDIDWIYDLSEADPEETWLPLFSITTEEGKDPVWWNIRARLERDDEDSVEILECYSPWMPIPTVFAVQQSEVNIQPGDRVRVQIEINVRGGDPFRVEGTIVFVTGEDDHISLKVNGESNETSTQARTKVPVEITISGDEDERPVGLRYMRGDGRGWQYIGQYRPGDDTVRFTEMFDSGDRMVVVQGEYIVNGESVWSSSVSNAVTVHVTASETAKEAIFAVSPQTVTRGGLVTVNVTGAYDSEEEGAEQKTPTFFSINFRNDDGADRNGQFLEAAIPFTVQIPTSELEAGDWYVYVDTSATNCEWNCDGRGRQLITVTEPEDGEVILEIPETIHADMDFPVSAYAKGADKIVIHYLKAGEGEEDPEDYPDTYGGECVFINGQRLEEGDYTIWAEAWYLDQDTEEWTSAESSPRETRQIRYEGTATVALTGPADNAFEVNSELGLQFTVAGLENHTSSWRVEVRDNDGEIISEWTDWDGPEAVNGVTTFSVTEGLSCGERYYIKAEAWGEPGWRGDFAEIQVLGIETTTGMALSLDPEEIMISGHVTATVTGVPANATYVQLIKEYGNTDIKRVDAETHTATFEAELHNKGTWTYWARYTTQNVPVDDNDIWAYDWDSVTWAGGSNAATLTVSSRGRLPEPDVTLSNTAWDENYTSGYTQGDVLKVTINSDPTGEYLTGHEFWYYVNIFRGIDYDEEQDEWTWSHEDHQDRMGRGSQILIPTYDYAPGKYRICIGMGTAEWEDNEKAFIIDIVEAEEAPAFVLQIGTTELQTCEETEILLYAKDAERVGVIITRSEDPEWQDERWDDRETGRWSWSAGAADEYTITPYVDGIAMQEETMTLQVSATGSLKDPEIGMASVITAGSDLTVNVTAKGTKPAEGEASDESIIADDVHIQLTDVSGPQGWSRGEGTIYPDADGTGSYTFSGNEFDYEGIYQVDAHSNKRNWNSGHAEKQVIVVNDAKDTTKTVTLTIDGRNDAQMTYPSSRQMRIEVSAPGADAIRLINGNQREDREGDRFDEYRNYGGDTVIMAMASYDDGLTWTGWSNIIEVKITNEGSLGEPNFGPISNSYTRGETLTVTIGEDPATDKEVEIAPAVWYYAEIDRQETDGDNNTYWNHLPEWHWNWTGAEDRKFNISTFPLEPGNYRLRIVVDAEGWRDNMVEAGTFTIVNPNEFVTDIPEEIPANSEREYYALIPGAALTRYHVLKKNDQNEYDEYFGWNEWIEGDCARIPLNIGTAGEFRVVFEAEGASGSDWSETKDFTVTGSELEGEIRITMAAPWTSGALRFSIVTTDPEVYFKVDIQEEGAGGNHWFYRMQRDIEIDGSELSSDCDYRISVEQWKEGYVNSYRNYWIRREAAGQTLELPASLTTLESEAFRGINARMIIIPNYVTRIEENTFADCPNLAAVVIPNSVTKIDEYAFGYTWNMTVYGSSNTAKTFADSKGYGYIELTGE